MRPSLLTTLIMLAGCAAPPVESPTSIEWVETTVRSPRKRDRVDILFVVDNSGSMTPKQTELKNRFGDLIRKLESFKDQGHGAHYHIGVVTTEVERSGADCSGRSGPAGRLVARGAAADASCQAVSGGKRYIDYNQNDGSNNLPSGQTLERTFQCMASVGKDGCGLEMQLESAYRALKDPPVENEGFLRPEALLVVVFITDEDDCSMAADSPLFGVGDLDAYPDGLGFPGSFRCVQFGYQCGGQQPPSQVGFLDMCGPLPNPDNDPGKLMDVQKYLDFFTKDGGAKEKRENVILVSISGLANGGGGDPANRIETILYTVGTGAPCPAYKVDPVNFDRSCIFGVRPTCFSPAQPSWTGDPAVRLEAVVNAAVNHQVTSICDDSYAPALEGVGERIIGALANCLTQPIATPDRPECVVQELADDNGTLSTTGVIPACDSRGVKPCWSLESNLICPGVFSPLTMTIENFEVKIDRGTVPEAPDHILAISCSTLAHQ